MFKIWWFNNALLVLKCIETTLKKKTHVELDCSVSTDKWMTKQQALLWLTGTDCLAPSSFLYRLWTAFQWTEDIFKKKITQLLCNYSYHFQLFQFLFFKYMVCKSLPSNFIHVSCSFNYKYYCSRTNILHITAKCFNNTILTLQSFTATRRFTRV